MFVRRRLNLRNFESMRIRGRTGRVRLYFSGDFLAKNGSYNDGRHGQPTLLSVGSSTPVLVSITIDHDDTGSPVTRPRSLLLWLFRKTIIAQLADFLIVSITLTLTSIPSHPARVTIVSRRTSGYITVLILLCLMCSASLSFAFALSVHQTSDQHKRHSNLSPSLNFHNYCLLHRSFAASFLPIALLQFHFTPLSDQPNTRSICRLFYLQSDVNKLNVLGSFGCKSTKPEVVNPA
jgi:hypothetical protein